MTENQEKRLEQFEKMLQSVQTEYKSIVRQMEELKKKGKIRSVTYQQLMTRKLTYQNMISMYELYDLESDPEETTDRYEDEDAADVRAQLQPELDDWFRVQYSRYPK